jgi:hypothetical protein
VTNKHSERRFPGRFLSLCGILISREKKRERRGEEKFVDIGR